MLLLGEQTQYRTLQQFTNLLRRCPLIQGAPTPARIRRVFRPQFSGGATLTPSSGTPSSSSSTLRTNLRSAAPGRLLPTLPEETLRSLNRDTSCTKPEEKQSSQPRGHDVVVRGLARNVDLSLSQVRETSSEQKEEPLPRDEQVQHTLFSLTSRA